MKTRFATGLAVTALAILLTGCTGGGGDTTAPSADTGTTQATPDTSTPAATVELKTADSNLGKIVVDSAGMTLYMFDSDTQGSGKSSCEGGCLTNWPPLTTKADTPAVDGVTGKVGTIAATDGSKQVTLNGWPLYYFVGDKAAGDTNGQGVGGIWWVLDPAGEKISQ